MANGITDLGNNIGYLYKTLADGTTIMAVERNTIEGAKSIQQMGVTNGPIVAGRGAQGAIVVSSSGGAGDITNIDVAGVNQIAANITVTSTNTTTVATQIANAINAYTPPVGYKFNASAIANTVYLFSSPADGDAVNGLTITVSVTNPGIVTTTVDFANGSSDFGVYDNTLGYRFFINADYAGVATPYSKGVKSVEITEYITLRGLQSGIITINRTVTNDRIASISRASAITQVVVDTQGGAPTDVLAYISPSNFVEGDSLIIRGTDPAQVVTLEDATITTSLVATPNIYLTDASPFSLTGFKSIHLQFRNDPSLGPIWVEIGRSLAFNPVTTTLAQFIIDCNNSALGAGQVYFVTDLGNGTYINAITESDYNPVATWIRKVPVSYAGCWRTNMAAPTIGLTYRYNQLSYKSLTGVVGSTPSTDLVNWQLVPYTTVGAYSSQYNAIILNSVPGELTVWPVIEERDQNGNCVIQTKENYITTTVNAFNVFCWNTNGVNFYGNYVHNSVFDVANSDGKVYQNRVTEGSSFKNNRMGASSVVANNIIKSSIVEGNYITYMSLNNFYNALVQNNGTSTNAWPQINANTLNNGYIISNTGTNLGAEIVGNTIGYAASIDNNTLGTAGKIRYNTLNATCAIKNCVLDLPTASADIESNTLTGNSELVFNKSTPSGNQITDSLLQDSKITLTTTPAGASNISNCTFVSCTITSWSKHEALNCNFSNCDISFDLKAYFDNCNIVGWTTTAPFDHSLLGTIMNANVSCGVSSSLEYTLDLDDPTIFAANILAFPYATSLGAQFNLTSVAASKTIDEIVDLPNFKQVVFYNSTLGVCSVTFNKVNPGLWSGNLIVGAANFTLNSDAAGPSDYMTMTKYQSAVNMITGGVNL